MRLCTIDWCNNDVKYQGLCRMHYERKRRGQNMDAPPRASKNTLPTGPNDESLMGYLTPRFSREGNCVVWRGACAGRNGDRPRVELADGRSYSVYRLVMANHMECDIDQMPPVHHTCANTKCVNINHLQLVTVRENTAEMLERQFYKKRIKNLEAELGKFDPTNELLR